MIPGSNPGLLLCRRIPYLLSHQGREGSPSQTQRKKDMSMKVGEGAGGVGRQRKQRPARLGLDRWGHPESPAGHRPALVYQLAGAGARTPPVPAVPHRGLRGSIFPGSAPTPSRPGTRASGASSSSGNTQQQGEASQQTRGRAVTRGHFRTWLLRGTLRGRGPLAAGRRDHRPPPPPSPGPSAVRLSWVLNAPGAGRREQRLSRQAGSWECGSRQGSPIFTAAVGPCWTSG